jgi:hypothetical protein
MRSCKDVHKLVAESMDRELGFIDRFAMRAHLLICIHCTRFMQNMKLLRAAMRRFPGDDG